MVLLLFTLLGFALRLPLLHRFPLREDEAIYGYWALHGWLVDPLFLQVWPDKPPVFLWLLGLAFHLFGHAPVTADAAARFVNIVAGTLTIPVLAVTARRWWGDAAAIVAALLAALNPFAISFGPTAFTDPVLVAAGSLALALAARRRFFWAGLWLGMAIMTKQQGILFIPLVVGAWAAGFREGGGLPGSPPLVRDALRLLAGLAVALFPVLTWDSLRWAVAPSPWELGAINAGGVVPLPPDAWPARVAGWGQLAWYLLASPFAWGAYALALGAALRRPGGRGGLPAAVLATWAAVFLLLHTVIGIQVWDRYLLPLTIPLVLLGGWAAGGASRKPAPAAQPPLLAFALLLLALLLSPAWQAAQGQLPVGGDHGDYAGLNETLAAVNRPDSLLFHRELGWHAHFALFDAVRSGDVQLRYYPSSVYLADAATKSPHKQRFVIIPDWSPMPDLPMQLAMRGMQAETVLRAGLFAVYRIDERRAGAASWRVCALPQAGPFVVQSTLDVSVCRETPPER